MSSNMQIYTFPQLSVTDPSLETLRRAVGEEIAQQFFWKAETDTIQTYEHRHTSRYIHIDSETGQFYNQQRMPISVESALEHAQRPMETRIAQILSIPLALEPDLAPYVRCFRDESMLSRFPGASSVTLGSGRPSGVCADMFRRLRVRVQTALSYAKSASLPVRSQTMELRANLQTSDLSVSNFTRRVA